MVSLIEVTEDNYQTVCSLEVSAEQKCYVAAPVSILARAYAKRNRNARALAITNDGTIIGVLMYMDLHEEPACYTIEQFLIDHRFQNRGFGTLALQSVIDILKNERKYEAVEICVKKEAAQAIKVYKNAGFADTGYIDPDAPDSLCLRYTFSSEHASDYSVITATFPDENSAKNAAGMLVEHRLAACVQMLPINSVYSWKGKVCNDDEVLLVIKSKTELFGEITTTIKDAHVYEVPEIIQLPVINGLPEYLKWIDDNTKRESGTD